MVVAFVADLHVDDNQDYPVLDTLSRYCKDKKVEALFVAGDISSSQTLTIRSMEELEQLCGFPCYYIPGNHDLWQENPVDGQTDLLYEKFCQQPRCLSGKSLVLGDCTFIGDVAWYDYSFGGESYSLPDFEKMQHGNRIWQDKLKNSWTKNNLSCFELFYDKFEKLLASSQTTKTVVLTHMLPIREFCVEPHIKNWGYFNAFLGSERLGALFAEYGVDFSVCGHVHYREQITQNGVTWICPCLGYHSEWKRNPDISLEKEMEQSVVIVDL